MPRRLSLFIIIILLLGLAATIFLLYQTTSFSGQAFLSTSSSSTIDNSYLFASPISAQANGQELIRITIFILDNRGLGLANQPIFLSVPSQIILKKTATVTDETGRATFDISTTASGTYTLSAKSGSVELPQKVKVVFN